MNKQTEALKMAIEALEESNGVLDTATWKTFNHTKAIKSCKEALEQTAQEPVEVYGILDGSDYVSVEETEEGAKKQCEFMNQHDCDCTYKPLYTRPAPSQWISVKDRLPEFVDISDFEKSSNDVLILIDEKHIYIGSYIRDSYSQETEFCMRDLDGGYEGIGDMNVTHWMPLPEAPKE